MEFLVLSEVDVSQPTTAIIGGTYESKRPACRGSRF